MTFEDTQNLVSSDKAHLGNTVRVTEGNTNLGRGETLASQLDDVFHDVLGGGLEP